MKSYKIILIIIIVIILFKLTSYKENYDGVIRNIENIEDCADLASSIYDVSAFSYDPVFNNCYISKTSLSRPPIQIHPYHNEFKITDRICNKNNFIRKSRENITTTKMKTNNLIANRLYDCYINKGNANDNTTQYYFEKNKPGIIINNNNNNNNVEKLSVTEYKMFDIDWPVEKRELNDINVSYSINALNKTEIKKEIDGITWKPKINIPRPVKGPFDLYDDSNNKNLFKIDKNKCIETVHFEKPSYLDIYDKKLI
jgi:hypothetical protein